MLVHCRSDGSCRFSGLALQIAARTRLDLILLDIVMPGLDGYEV